MSLSFVLRNDSWLVMLYYTSVVLVKKSYYCCPVMQCVKFRTGIESYSWLRASSPPHYYERKVQVAKNTLAGRVTLILGRMT